MLLHFIGVEKKRSKTGVCLKETSSYDMLSNHRPVGKVWGEAVSDMHLNQNSTCSGAACFAQVTL